MDSESDDEIMEVTPEGVPVKNRVRQPPPPPRQPPPPPRQPTPPPRQAQRPQPPQRQAPRPRPPPSPPSPAPSEPRSESRDRNGRRFFSRCPSEISVRPDVIAHPIPLPPPPPLLNCSIRVPNPVQIVMFTKQGSAEIGKNSLNETVDLEDEDDFTDSSTGMETDQNEIGFGGESLMPGLTRSVPSTSTQSTTVLEDGSKSSGSEPLPLTEELAEETNRPETCCGCQEVKDSILRIHSTLYEFDDLAQSLEASFVILADAVKYLPVPPSPTVADERETYDQQTIDMDLEVEDALDQVPLSHRRNLFSDQEPEIEATVTPPAIAAPTASTSPPSPRRVVFKCDICTSLFLTEGALSDHKATHIETGLSDSSSVEEDDDDDDEDYICEADREFSCNSCDKTFPTKKGLVGHEKRHRESDALPFHCSLCLMGFRTERNCSAHEQRHLSPEPDKRPFSCEECGGKFTRADSLRRHQSNHGRTHKKVKTRSFDCSICSVGFGTSYSLKRHMSTHERGSRTRPEGPFKCTVCSKGFATKATRTYHERSHGNEDSRPFKCPVCSKGFASKAYCKQHEKRHNNAETRPFKCTVCEFGFKTQGDLRAHTNFSKCNRTGNHGPSNN